MNRRQLVWLMTLMGGVAIAENGDPPALVGRLSYSDGPVWVASDSAGVNWPVTQGDSIRTGEARAEVDLGAVVFRLDRHSDIALLALNEGLVRLNVSSGAITVEVREPTQLEPIRIQIRNATVELRQAGDYRLDAMTDQVRVVVRSGEGAIRTSQATFEQFRTEQAHIEPDGTVALTKASSSSDAFDTWTRERAKDPKNALSVRHVAKGVVGYEDLDRYGEWRWLPACGMAWKPRKVSREWAPYRFGQWIWKAPWGWTWVDDAPWAFAPSHYGRWINIDEAWHWLPGPRQLSPVYVPAVVGFTNSNGPDDIGWYPLEPGEAYTPPYRASDRYERRINTFSLAGSQQCFAEQPAAVHAITWTSESAFSGHPSPLEIQAELRHSARSRTFTSR
jgi:hypothetical protein